MAETHDLGSLFWSWDKRSYSPSPLVEHAPTVEIEEPYRVSRSLVVRIPFTRKIIVVGRWKSNRLSEQEALEMAIGYRLLPDSDF